MIRTKRVTVKAEGSAIAGRCTGFRLRPTFEPAAEWQLNSLTNNLAQFGTFPVEVVPVDTRGRMMDPIVVTGPEFIPLPAGVLALYARHLYPAARGYLMPFLLDLANGAADVLDTARNPGVLTTVLDARRQSTGASFLLPVPTFGLDAIVVEVEPLVNAADVSLLFLNPLALYGATYDWLAAGVNVAVGTKQLIVVGPKAQAWPAVPAAIVVQVPLPAEVMLVVNSAAGSDARIKARVALG
jgi:hypothetical protein